MADISVSDEEIIESIIGFDALYESMCKCKKGVLWKNSTAYFFLHGVEQTLKLENELKSGTYVAKEPKCFTLTHPKKRDAVSIAFRDRVYQRSLNDNVLYPVMTASFIAENLACQKGKGTDLARDTLDRFLREMYRKYGLNVYVLQGDVHGYYPNMSHQKTEDKFDAKLPRPVFEMVRDVLRHQYGGEKGYNPGSQMIQIAGISYLDKFDHFVKEQLHIRWYLRYMDDFILLHPDKEYLEYCKNRIAEFMKKEECELHPKKTKLYKAEDGIPFLGFTHRLTTTGKIVRIIDPANVKAERKKLRREVALVRKGRIDKRKVDEGFKCWKAHAEKGNSFKLIQRMEQYYKTLWEE